MLKLKNITQKLLESQPEKRRFKQNDDKSFSMSAHNVVLNKSYVTLLTQWLEQLNEEQLIIITDQNDIVIMAGGKNDQAQQIFINCDDVDDYMEAKLDSREAIYESKIIRMSDIAQILLKYGYVNESAGQLSFSAQTISLDSNELKWLRSIVREARPDPTSFETHVKLYDGENMQLLHIPYEHMAPTNDTRIVATYLFRNGHVRYDVNTGTYAYRYVEPDTLLDEKTKSPERIRQRQLLSFHIRQIYIDEQNERVELEFLHEPNRRLVLPTRWYRQVFAHGFDRDYIIDVLLANGGVINQDTFFFMGRAYSLHVPRINTSISAIVPSTNLETVNLSLKEKYDLIRYYIDLIIEQGGVKRDEANGLLVLENVADGRRLYFTSKDSLFIRQNQFQREDVIDLLVQHGQIKQNEFGNWLLYYNNQYIRFPSSLVPLSTASSQKMSSLIRPQNERPSLRSLQRSRSFTATTVDVSEAEYRQRYHNIIDYMCRHGLVTWDKPLGLIKLHFVDQTLLLPINHLRSIIDLRVVSSSSTIDGVLPFSSRQLSQWLLNNSYIMRNNPLRS